MQMRKFENGACAVAMLNDGRVKVSLLSGGEEMASIEMGAHEAVLLAQRLIAAATAPTSPPASATRTPGR